MAKYSQILTKYGQILTIFGHFWGQKFFRPKHFLMPFKVVWRPNFMQKIRKKYQTVKAVGPERTNGRTDARTYESEFIGSFRSLKTSGEPTKALLMQNLERL